MITATFTESGRNLSIRLEGHAGYAEHGKDIVCASATILAYTLAQTIKDAEHFGYLASAPVIKLDSGDTLLSCEAADEENRVLMRCMFAFAVKGFALLEHNYPKYVKLML